jgi:single-strand DNA-binding protein
MQLTGLLKVKGDTRIINERFQVREFVITEDSTKWQQHITFQLIQDTCDIIEDITEGDRIRVKFEIRGKEWKDRYINSLIATEVQRIK